MGIIKIMKSLQINHIEKKLHAQGPGIRYTIWTQGCSIRCPGCSNTDTWSFNRGFKYSTDSLVKEILDIDGLDGITITGGEPLDQYDAVLGLCESLFNKICIFLTTGYEFIRREHFDIISFLDILCLGPFQADNICKDGWRGSSNQRVVFLTDRGKKQKEMPLIYKEIIVSPKGDALETGFHI
jgi:anaerobic ribonucleoside-triphosphate reductase activating protein